MASAYNVPPVVALPYNFRPNGSTPSAFAPGVSPVVARLWLSPYNVPPVVALPYNLRPSGSTPFGFRPRTAFPRWLTPLIIIPLYGFRPTAFPR